MNMQSLYPHTLKPIPNGNTKFRDPGFPPRVELNRSESEITSRTQNYEETLTLSGDENAVNIDRQGYYNDVTISREGENISVNRPGSNDMQVLRDENSLKVDRPGVQFDVNATFSDDKIQIQQYGSTTTLERHGDDVVVSYDGFPLEMFPEKLFPGGSWPEKPSLTAIAEFSGMEARPADMLDRWASEGIKFDDLVRVNRQGEVYTFDDELT